MLLPNARRRCQAYSRTTGFEGVGFGWLMWGGGDLLGVPTMATPAAGATVGGASAGVAAGAGVITG